MPVPSQTQSGAKITVYLFMYITLLDFETQTT